MKADVILAIDPSGAYHEGKGTSGWCAGTNTGALITVSEIKAVNFDTVYAYREQHRLLIESFFLQFKNIHVVMEDYAIYADRANSHIGSHLETSQLLGILEHYCGEKGIPVFRQPAGVVKMRWANSVLMRKRLIKYVKGHYYLYEDEEILKNSLSDHELDSIRHYMHHLYFKNV